MQQHRSLQSHLSSYQEERSLGIVWKLQVFLKHSHLVYDGGTETAHI